jgi:hypothetical protein
VVHRPFHALVAQGEELEPRLFVLALWTTPDRGGPLTEKRFVAAIGVSLGAIGTRRKAVVAPASAFFRPPPESTPLAPSQRPSNRPDGDPAGRSTSTTSPPSVSVPVSAMSTPTRS